jgi:hypothetical protein
VPGHFESRIDCGIGKSVRGMIEGKKEEKKMAAFEEEAYWSHSSRLLQQSR